MDQAIPLTFYNFPEFGPVERYCRHQTSPQVKLGSTASLRRETIRGATRPSGQWQVHGGLV
jgi:hypothetical protein